MTDIRIDAWLSQSSTGKFTEYARQSLATLYPVHSVTKSLLSLLWGVYCYEHGEGVLEKPIASWLESPNHDSRVEFWTLRTLLEQKSSLAWKEYGLPFAPGNSCYQWEREHQDWISAIWHWPLDESHRNRFVYCTGVSHLLGYALERLVDGPLEEYAQEKIWKPLGIRKWNWKKDPQGRVMGGRGLELDIHGLWALHLPLKGSDVVSIAPIWRKEGIAVSVDAGSKSTYGWHWWRKGDIAFASGYGGKICAYHLAHGGSVAMIAENAPGFEAKALGMVQNFLDSGRLPDFR